MITKKLLLAPLALLLLAPFTTAQAAILQADDRLSFSLPIQDDLYAAGGEVRIREDITGDAVLAGGDIIISSNIQQDLTVAGGDVDIDGTIGDDLRAAGGTLYLSAVVEDDAFLMGGEVNIRPETVIKGDLRVAGGDIVIDGAINGDVYIQGGSVLINGPVGGNVSVAADALYLNAAVGGNVQFTAKQFEAGEQLAIAGNVRYWQASGPYTFTEEQVQGEALYDEEMAVRAQDRGKKTAVSAMAAMFIYSLLASALIIALCLLLTKTYFADAAKRLRKAPGMSIWLGFLYVIVTPFLALLFFLTIIGIPIGLLLVISYLFTFYFVKPMTALVFAKVLEAKYTSGKKHWNSITLFFVSLLILLVWQLILLVPVVGIIVSAVAVLAGFGTLAHTEWHKFKKIR